MERKMKNLINFLEELEKTVYKILVWIVLIPKTLFQVVVRPKWAMGYIKEELGPGGSRFDEYLSPIALLFTVALLPAIIWNFLPTYGVGISSPSIDNPSANRSLEFTAGMTFQSTAKGFVNVFWRVERVERTEGGYVFPTIRIEKYTNDPQETGSYYNFYQVGVNSFEDYFQHTFTTPGDYFVVVQVYKFDTDGNLIESHTNEVFVGVPTDSEIPVEVSVYSQPNREDNRFELEKALGELHSERTYLIALGLMFPPLLFSLASRLLGRRELSEDSLREIFYVQCYYFAPLGFVFWASMYAWYFVTPDVFGYYDTNSYLLITLLPMLLIIFWYVGVQTYVMAEERGVNAFIAFIIVLCLAIFLLGFAFYILLFNTPEVREGTRLYSIWLYPLAAIAILSIYHWVNVQKNWKENRSAVWGNVFSIALMLVVIVFVGIWVRSGGRHIKSSEAFNKEQYGFATESVATLTSIAVFRQTPATPEQGDTLAADQATPIPTQIAVASTSTAVQPPAVIPSPEEPVTGGEEAIPTPQQFYTEEFDGSLALWPYFLTQGSESAVNFKLDGGRLYVQLAPPQDERPPFWYRVNNSFSYADVKIEMLVSNNGVNSNGVSLVCRYSEAGWYEFRVSNGGEYIISAYDAGGRFYYNLAIGGSPVINTGLSTNKYAAVCQGGDLTLIVNDVLVTTTLDRRFNFTEGLVGLGVASPQGLPVNVDFDYFRVSEP